MDGASSGASAPPRNEVANEAMCVYCFDVLMNHHNPRHPAAAPREIPHSQYPLFVTWQVSKNSSLRGCIGTFSAIDLRQGLRDYALTSALRDSRFSPIKWEEIAHLSCAVSLLTNFEEAENYLDWEIGIHGIRIAFEVKGSTKTATYLPEVAAEQGWDKMETIENLLKKGGYYQRVTQDYCRTIRLTRYRSEKVRLTYDDYAQYKQLVVQGKR